MAVRRFEEVEHPSDVALHVWGSNLAELFANAALGLAWQLADVASVSPVREDTFVLEAFDVETLLVTWLNELLYRAEQDGTVYTEFCAIEVAAAHLRATARGGPASQPGRPIKAATFSDLRIVHTAHGYETTVVFDV